ncbi:MAG: transglutaminase-like domain-containing protein [Methanobacteriota archaeon]
MIPQKTIIGILCVLLLLLPVIVSAETMDTQFLSPLAEDEVEVHLLRVEHYLVLTASASVDTCEVRFVFPPEYAYQVPLYLEIYNDSTAPLINYRIQNETPGVNKVVVFRLGSLVTGEEVLIHFSVWVLVDDHEFTDLPRFVRFPRVLSLPIETRVWLQRSPVVQIYNPLLQHKAEQLRGISPNMIRFAERVAYFIKHHRYGLFVVQLNSKIFFSQDALTTLLINGDNVGRSHLACALFRSQHIPARVLLAHNDQGFWTQMHYMVEYYVPGYGWVLLDSTKGETPYATSHQVIERVCYPGDEWDTKTDYIFRFMKGEERWLWITTPFVEPVYVDCDRGSKSQMFDEGSLVTSLALGENASWITSNVFHSYQHYLGMNLSGVNKTYYENAVQYQKQALNVFQNTSDLEMFIQVMNQALGEYQKIIV